MLADFTIHIHDSRKPLAVQVKVHESTAALRSAITQYDKANHPRRKGSKPRPTAAEEGILGVCHRFHWDSNPVCAIVRLAPPHIGIGVVSHELAHAAVWIREIEESFDAPALTSDNDERFCWILGELVRHTVDKMYEKGIYQS